MDELGLSSNGRAELTTSVNELRASRLCGGQNTYDEAAGIFASSVVKKNLGIQLPKISDCTDLVAEVIKPSRIDGRVFALRFDQTEGPANLKGPIFGGLLIRHILRGRLNSEVQCLADAGNMNSGFSLQYICKRMNLGGHYVISRYFPEDMLRMLERNWFRVEIAPARNDLSVEREFYEHLVRRMRDVDHRKRTLCFFHAKHGIRMAAAFGRLMKLRLERLAPTKVDISDVHLCIGSIGSGASLTWMREMIARDDVSYIVPEHENTPVFRRHVLSVPIYDIQESCLRLSSEDDNVFGNFRQPLDSRIGSAILGPHFEEENPFIHPFENVANALAIYDDETWMRFATRLRSVGVHIGNSSAVNLMCAAYFAARGRTVLTSIYEPDRPYYYAASASGNEDPQALHDIKAYGMARTSGVHLNPRLL